MLHLLNFCVECGSIYCWLCSGGRVLSVPFETQFCKLKKGGSKGDLHRAYYLCVIVRLYINIYCIYTYMNNCDVISANLKSFICNLVTTAYTCIGFPGGLKG